MSAVAETGVKQMKENGQVVSHPTPWVKLCKYVEITGDTADAVHARRKAGKWLDGKQCKIVDGSLYVNLAEYQKWIEQWGTTQSRAA